MLEGRDEEVCLVFINRMFPIKWLRILGPDFVIVLVMVVFNRNRQLFLLLVIQYYNQFSFEIQGNMATQIQIYQNFPSIHETCSDISTEGEDEIMNFCKDKCFENSFKFKTSSNNKVKSSLCKNFAQTGLCPYGDKCQFAHGTHQLRCNAEINISYKTKYCNSFLNKKCCIYGFRCNFIHKNSMEVDEQEKWNKIYSNHRETIQECRQGDKSRLLTILGLSSA